MRKTYSIVFNGKEVILSKDGLNIVFDLLDNVNEDSVALRSNVMGNIASTLKKLHSNHLKDIATETFEADTKVFLKGIVKDCLDNIERFDDTYTKSSIGWKKLLPDIKKEIEYQLEIETTENPDDSYYPHRIKILDSSIDVEKHTITTIIRNLRNDHIVQAIISLTLKKECAPSTTLIFLSTRKEDVIKVSVKMKTGSIVFK